MSFLVMIVLSLCEQLFIQTPMPVGDYGGYKTGVVFSLLSLDAAILCENKLSYDNLYWSDKQEYSH